VKSIIRLIEVVARASPRMGIGLAHRGGYIIISDRVKVNESYFPKYLAHEGLHRADFLAGRLQGVGKAFILARELRDYAIQHEFAIKLRIYDSLMSNNRNPDV
jgi:hypothetical protein